MKHTLIIFLALCCFFRYGHAQSISTEKGLTTLVYNTSDAVITVYLPDDFQNGDKISGTFTVFNEGLTDEQLAKSLAEVRKYKFNFSNPENQTSVLQRLVNVKPNQLTNLLPLKIYTSLILTLTESTGIVYEKELKPIDDPILPVNDCIVPLHLLSGEPLRIIGTFDGNAANTRVSIGNTVFPILAESPRQCIVQVPDNLPLEDSLEIKITEDFKPKCTQTVAMVKMYVAYDKFKVKKGENATITVTLKGMRGITDDATLFLENATPDVIDVKDGNKQQLKISPAMAGTDEYKISFTAKGIADGNFELNFKLNLPEDFPDMMEK